jgi:hypothetical protein
MTVVLSSILGFLGGVIAWFATRFVAAPLADFYAIRNEAAQAFHFHANVIGVEGIADAREQGRVEFRRLAGRLAALDATAVAPLRWHFRRFNYDLAQATAGLTGYSNALAVKAYGFRDNCANRKGKDSSCRLTITIWQFTRDRSA